MTAAQTALASLPMERAQPRSTRIDWIDSARGLGIVLVVIGHALGGLIDSQPGAALGPFRQVFFAIYLFHMPLFFLLSGLLVAARIGRGPKRFARSLLPSIAWPYFLWSAVQFTVIWAMGSLVNRPAGAWLPTVLSLPWNTVSQYWFLYALFWMHVIALVVLPRLGREALLPIGIALKLAVPVFAAPVVMKLVANNFVWYALGACLGAEGVERIVVRRSALVRGLILPVLAVAAILWALGVAMVETEPSLATAGSPQIASLAWRLAFAPPALLGTAAALGLASLPAFVTGAFSRLGQLTMPIFVLHVMFIAGTRIVLVRAGLVAEPNALLGLLVGAGLVGPLLTERLLRPLGLQSWLGF